MSRVFTDTEATREQVPCLVGLTGPSSSGKTLSGILLAKGIQEVVGGDIGVIDTEASRSKHYADRYKFRHLDFKPPFNPLSYLDAINHFAKKGVKTIMVDSMSHEHEGPGGVLEMHEDELNRIAGQDYGKRDKVKMLAWAKPKQERRRLINEIIQLGIHGIFCFRAKEKIKMVKGQDPIPMGWSPIGGEEFIYEMTASIFLPPGCNGKPDWEPKELGEKALIKLPYQFRGVINDGKPLCEDHGRKLAEWAAGTDSKRIIEDLSTKITSCQNTADLILVKEEVSKKPIFIQRALKDVYNTKEQELKGIK